MNWNVWKKGKQLTSSFFIIGAQKSGTTSLYGNLAQHPEILPANRKEIYYYNNRNINSKGQPWCTKQFPKTTLANAITGDATANYFESDFAPEKIKQDFPNAKIILILRNPVERAYSHYKMAVKHGLEYLSFEEALELEEKRLAYASQNYVPQLQHDYVFQRLGYQSKGIYVQFLKNWLKHFSLYELLIIDSQTYFNDTNIVYKQVLKFLDLATYLPTCFDKLQQGNQQKTQEQTRAKLANFYQPYNEELYALIGTSYNW